MFDNIACTWVPKRKNVKAFGWAREHKPLLMFFNIHIKFPLVDTCNDLIEPNAYAA